MRGEGQVKLITCAMAYFAVGWTCWGVACSQKNCKWASALLITNTDYGTTKLSASGSLGSISWVQKAALEMYRRIVPLLHTSTQCPGMSWLVLPAFPLRYYQRWGEKAWVRGLVLRTQNSSGNIKTGWWRGKSPHTYCDVNLVSTFLTAYVIFEPLT